MVEEQFMFEYPITLSQGSVSWESPSNIALVKYWGKYDLQLPKNPSLSFTLSKSNTRTTLSYTRKNGHGFDLEVYLDGIRAADFEPKIHTFFKRVLPYLPFLEKFQFRIDTTNSFPHSSGIASSASGMSALALCLLSMEKEMNSDVSDDLFLQKASFLARLGSGSACRSIEGDLVVWGEHPEIEYSSDLYGIKYPYKVHECFKNYQDTILLVDKGEKEVSSTLGHELMQGHAFAEQRFQQAKNHLSRLIRVLEKGKISEFITIVESEALSLHAMMLTSQPYFILMKPNTLEIINRIWKYRAETGSAVCFTLDAGANVHVLYPLSEKTQVLNFIKTDLIKFCKNGEFIEDHTGCGAIKK